MSQHLVIQLLGRQVTVIDAGTGKPVDDGHGVAVPYDTAQHGVERGILRAMSAVGLTHGDVAHENVAAALKVQVEAGAVRLTLRGHERELAVAALHLRLRFGMPALAPGTPWSPGHIEVEHVRGASDFYETFDIDTGISKLKAFAEVVRQWSAMEGGGTKKRAAQADSLLRQLELGTSARPLTIVVTGATGKGKSTFVNALLRRSVLPQSGEGVCTAVNIKMRYAEEAAAEGVRVHWRRDIEDRHRRLAAEKKQLESKRARLKEKALHAKQHIQDLVVHGAQEHDNEEESARLRRLAEVDRLLGAAAEAEKLRRTSDRRLLSELARYAQVSGGIDVFVDHVEVFLHHPLLRLVQLVDAPGLRDSDEERKSAAMRAFEGDSAWLYLHRLSDREATWKEDVEQIRSWANNSSGILVRTCADEAQPDKGRSLQEFAARETHSKEHSAFTGEKEWCAALPVLTMVRGLATRSDRERVRIGVERLLGCENEDRWIDTFDGELRAAAIDPALLDYVYDASRLPACVQRAVRALYRQAVESRLRDARRELQGEVEEAVALIEKEVTAQEEALEALASVEKMNAHLEALERRCDDHRRSLESARSDTETILANITETHREYRVAFDEAAKGLSSELKSKVETLVKSGTSGKWWAKFEVPVFEFYAVPLARAARSILDEARRATAGLVKAAPDDLVADLTNKILADDAFRGDTFQEKEGAWEWHDTALQRAVKRAQERAEIEHSQIREGFSKELSRMRASAQRLRDKAADDWEARIAADRKQIADTKRDIDQKNPGRSKLVYEANLAAARETLSVLRAFQAKHGFGDGAPSPANALALIEERVSTRSEER